jgi:hypothetical protein
MVLCRLSMSYYGETYKEMWGEPIATKKVHFWNI